MSTTETSIEDHQAGATNGEDAAAEQAIDEAVAYANITLAAGDAGDAGENVKPVVRTELSPEERKTLSRKIARAQRIRGAEELEREYPGTIVIRRPLVVSDPNIASSSERFLGLTDRTLYLLNRFGFRYHTAAELEAIRASIAGAVDKYCEEADAALVQGTALSTEAKDSNLDWLAPEYTSKTLDKLFGVKARDTLKLIAAVEKWDKAILEFAALEFNQSGSIGQIDTMRQRERRLFMAINTICVRTIRGFSKRRTTLAQGGNKSGAKATESAEPAVA